MSFVAFQGAFTICVGVFNEILPLNIFVAAVGLEPTLLWRAILHLKKAKC